MGLLFVIQKHSEAYCNIVQISYELSFVYFKQVFCLLRNHSEAFPSQASFWRCSRVFLLTLNIFHTLL